MGPSNSSYLSNVAIFHFHDSGKKYISNKISKSWNEGNLPDTIQSTFFREKKPATTWLSLSPFPAETNKLPQEVRYFSLKQFGSWGKSLNRIFSTYFVQIYAQTSDKFKHLPLAEWVSHPIVVSSNRESHTGGYSCHLNRATFSELQILDPNKSSTFNRNTSFLWLINQPP